MTPGYSSTTEGSFYDRRIVIIHKIAHTLVKNIDPVEKRPLF